LRVEENFTLDKRSDFACGFKSTMIAVVVDTEVQHKARSLDICVSLACKPNVYGSLWCRGRRYQAAA
jgi:hypothetical protein